jgi:hypothetical protein
VNFESFDIMKPTLQRITISCLVASLAALVACKTPPAPSGGAPDAVASVKPGINAEYLKPDLNVSNWVERFEKEGREIYDHREKIVAAVGVRRGFGGGRHRQRNRALHARCWRPRPAHEGQGHRRGHRSEFSSS